MWETGGKGGAWVWCGLFLCPPPWVYLPEMLTSFTMGDDCDTRGFAAGAALCLVAALPAVKHLTVVAL